jgi:uncharacterized protein (TIGR00661 family)
MRILYGVQATGNGHITRARVMQPALAAAGIEVDYLFTGRAEEAYFDMQPFAEYQIRKGFTLQSRAGKIQPWQTLKTLDLIEFWRDVRALDLSTYDYVLTDFEPISAWAARRQKVPCIGLAHQYALVHPIPGTEKAFWLAPAIRNFAPANIPLGIHWQSFERGILPPMIPALPTYPYAEQNFILVYLPFEALTEVCVWLAQCPEQRFRVYTSQSPIDAIENVEIRSLCRETFPQDLARCQGVICNTGFGLCSEAILLGKKLLTRPLSGQIEQESNAAVLEKMGRAQILHQFDLDSLRAWLRTENWPASVYPRVADEVVAWLKAGAQESAESLAQRLWQATHLPVKV